jgi:bifunctional enzyme CysN/CysC
MGEITGFTGVDSPYEPPLAAELVVDTVCESAEDAAARMAQYYTERFGTTLSR